MFRREELEGDENLVVQDNGIKLQGEREVV